MAKPVFSDDERQYLQMMQTNIERMATNSANCKTWAVSLIAGFLALSTGIDQLNWWLFLAIVPVLMFWYLDGYYLSIERGMRNRQRDFLNKQTVDNEEYAQALYNFSKLEAPKDDEDTGMKKTTWCWFTASVCPFYAIITVLIIAATLVICLFNDK